MNASSSRSSTRSCVPRPPSRTAGSSPLAIRRLTLFSDSFSRSATSRTVSSCGVRTSVSIAPDYRPVGTTDSVLVTLVLASDGSTDVVARVIAALGLGVAIVGIVVNWLLWYRSRPRLKVRLHAETDPDPMRGALAIEVVSVGRLAVVVKELGLRDHIVAGNRR
jgi:hypothetical protein